MGTEVDYTYGKESLTMGPVQYWTHGCYGIEIQTPWRSGPPRRLTSKGRRMITHFIGPCQCGSPREDSRCWIEY
ncbi:hypothetical protein PAXRUDRAFT_825073 [Paxillus rubicundulus Ve08.2h10]|uniref:Uncharacterized protein n=1 Tax=Paxillus rubicundulus Ve08.2h10 TaxID=930991 RepID=A0A0D0E121_9AGAM|nr:hypothetical protein PAXRUDRAFT_825073 [Paxillus rubicundulus Ve08.2h10]